VKESILHVFSPEKGLKSGEAQYRAMRESNVKTIGELYKSKTSDLAVEKPQRQ
jgi:hypothetical protein